MLTPATHVLMSHVPRPPYGPYPTTSSVAQLCAGFHPGQSLQPCPGARSSEARVSARPPCGPSCCCCCQSARISSLRRVILRYPTFTLERHWQCDLDRVWDLGTSASVALSAAITSRSPHPSRRAGAYTLLVGDRRLLRGHELGPSKPRRSSLTTRPSRPSSSGN